ncbi:multiple sugar transport system permease protein [Rhizobium sp. BK602]|nr:multiple sugar transport system permease protein [Rhizobium sp. BK602]
MTDAKLTHFSDDMNPPRERPWFLSILIHVALIAASIVMLYPLLWMLSGAVKDQNEIFGTASLIPSHFDFSSFPRGWFGGQVNFGSFVWNSAVIAVLSVIGNVLSCSLAAYAFARLNFWGKNFWFALMLGTLMLPYHVTLIPQYILFLKLGWVKTMLPLVVPKFLAVDAFFIFLMVQFFRGIPRELDEAAMMDGCSPWRIYWRIMLPLSLPVLATAAIFSFIWTWDDFFGPLIYLSDINTYTVQLGLRSFVDSTGSSDWSSLFAMSSISLIPVFLIFLFFQRLLIDGIATAGLKR